MFELILFCLVVVCGLTVFYCRYVSPDLATRNPEPWYLDYARSFFPVLLIVFLLRGFVAEPFRIPSGSMLPTLEVGDFILVNKFSYGIRLPVFHKKIIETNKPQRGEIMVFRYPKDNKTNYIKRVVGLPGDTIEYRNKTLYINGKQIEATADGEYTPFPIGGPARVHQRLTQALPNIGNEEGQANDFSILLDSDRYGAINKTIKVPEDSYFVMGDNRDYSLDSRYWGFVPDQNIVGKAFFIWFHWNSNPGGGVKLSRFGEDI